MNCKKCGKRIKKDVKYCPNCGRLVNKGDNKKKMSIFDIGVIVVCLIVFVLIITSMKKDMDEVYNFVDSAYNNRDKIRNQLYGD